MIIAINLINDIHQGFSVNLQCNETNSYLNKNPGLQQNTVQAATFDVATDYCRFVMTEMKGKTKGPFEDPCMVFNAMEVLCRQAGASRKENSKLFRNLNSTARTETA